MLSLFRLAQPRRRAILLRRARRDEVFEVVTFSKFVVRKPRMGSSTLRRPLPPVQQLQMRALRLGLAGVLVGPRILTRAWAALRPVRVDGQLLDPDTQWMLALLNRSPLPRLEEQSPQAARKQLRLLGQLADLPPPRVEHVSDLSFAGPAGPTRIRIYRPEGLGEQAPALVYYHGGGGVIGDLESADSTCRVLALEARCVVISVDYRLGPEHPAPGAQDDAVAAFVWVAERATHLGLDHERIAVGGDSAGGSLAALVGIETRQQERRPCFCLLIYPSVDRASQLPSLELFAEGFLQTKTLADWFHEHSLFEVDKKDPRISPLRTEDLRGCPPTWVGTAGFDLLRDEGEQYATRLREAGVSVTTTRFSSLIHGFINMAGVIPAAREALSTLARHLRAGLSRD